MPRHAGPTALLWTERQPRELVFETPLREFCNVAITTDAKPAPNGATAGTSRGIRREPWRGQRRRCRDAAASLAWPMDADGSLDRARRSSPRRLDSATPRAYLTISVTQASNPTERLRVGRAPWPPPGILLRAEDHMPPNLGQPHAYGRATTSVTSQLPLRELQSHQGRSAVWQYIVGQDSRQVARARADHGQALLAPTHVLPPAGARLSGD